MATTDSRTPLEITLADTVNLAPGIIVESALFGKCPLPGCSEETNESAVLQGCFHSWLHFQSLLSRKLLSVFAVWSWVALTGSYLHSRQGITTRSRVFMVLAMGVMYIASGIHWSVNVYTFIREIRDPVAWAALPIRIIYRWSVITTAALFLNVRVEHLSADWNRLRLIVSAKFWFSDIIVMWRAVVVWEWNRRVTVPCAILIVVPVRFPISVIQCIH